MILDIRDCRRALSSTSKLSLRYMGSLYTDFEPWKEDDEEDSKGLVFTDDLTKLKRYNALDTVVTARVFDKLRKEPEWKTARVQRLHQVHAELSDIAAEMHTSGFRVHQLNRDYLVYCMTQEIDEKQTSLQQLVGLGGWKPSPNAMRGLIFQRHETPKHKGMFHLPDPLDPAMWKSEETISVSYNSLLLIVIDPDTPQKLRDIIQLYWDVESVKKALGTFVTSKKVTQAIGKDGYLRPGWNSCGTDTGRWSCNAPNIMNIEQYIRALYCASPGHELVHADYSQLELRVMAAVAGDRELTRRLKLEDLYTEDAKEWFKLPLELTKDTIKPAARKQAKIVHLAKQYAAGVNAVYFQCLPQDNTMKYQTVGILCASFDRTYCDTVAYWRTEHERVRECGYSESRILHRRRTYPREPPPTETANYPVQSTASDIANLAMIAVRKKLKKYTPGAKLIVQLHDAFDVDTPRKHQGAVRRILEDEMPKPVEIDGKKYSFPITIKVGDTWDKL